MPKCMHTQTYCHSPSTVQVAGKLRPLYKPILVYLLLHCPAISEEIL